MTIRILLAMLMLLFLGCDDSKQKQAKIDPNKSVKVKILQNGQVKPVVLKPVKNLLQHTDFIGTTDNPTFDGGIINAADGLAVNEFRTPSLETHTMSQTTAADPVAVNIKNTKSFQSNFQDNWATSNKVKVLLKKAAADGKLDYVLKKTDEKGLPASVATVPMIESAYQENANSPKGAVGVWQLMPFTANDYGIDKNERYDLKPSTEAALNLLNDLHHEFKNWELTFAAYNAGAERVRKSLQQNPKAKSVQELNLPKETKDYVAHIMALNKTLESL
jgi:hypothetical protein